MVALEVGGATVGAEGIAALGVWAGAGIFDWAAGSTAPSLAAGGASLENGGILAGFAITKGFVGPLFAPSSRKGEMSVGGCCGFNFGAGGAVGDTGVVVGSALSILIGDMFKISFDVEEVIVFSASKVVSGIAAAVSLVVVEARVVIGED